MTTAEGGDLEHGNDTEVLLFLISVYYSDHFSLFGVRVLLHPCAPSRASAPAL